MTGRKPEQLDVPLAYTQELSRSLSARDTVLITLSSITPASSVFIIVPTILLGVGGASVLVMLAAAALCVAVGLCYAELSSRYPITGGEYTWAARLLGRTTGFAVFGLTLVAGLLITAVVALGTGEYLGVAIPALNGKWIGVGVIVVTTVIALANIRTNAWVTGIFLVVEVVAIVVLTVVGFRHPERGAGALVHATTAAGAGLGPAGFAVVVAAIPVALFAYNGYGAAVYYAEETRDATQVIARVVIACLIGAVVIEVVPLIAVVVGAPSLTDLLHSAAPMNYLLETRAGHAVNAAVSVGIAIAIINAVIAIILQISRLLFASARDGSWPAGVDRLLATVSKRTQVPVVATLVVGALSAVIAAVMPMSWLIAATGATLIPVYVAVAGAALRVRSRQRGGTYRMPWWPVPPLVVIAAMVLVVFESVRTDWTPIAVALGILAVAAGYFAAYLRPRLGERWSLLEAPEEV
ncbi:APC family permease [Tsukamurella soli]|uniref:APC family permease n=1 Tax=Tsukamurella soli TaxID=644556 RepID=A0ABP8JEI8_9ACTN